MLTGRRWTAIVGSVLVAVVLGCDHEGDDLAPETVVSIPLAPGYGPLGFKAPEPGTYELPPLNDAADGQLLASDGTATALHDLLGDKVVILSLMYASCSDVNGCPLATAVLHQVAKQMEVDEELAKGLRLLSLSFDPARDTPEVMRRYAGHHIGHGVDWQFLTTASKSELTPVLDAYGQSLVPEFDQDGNELGNISHILRVFLIDSSRRIRNIYSVSYLHAELLVADVKTLLRESSRRDMASKVASRVAQSSRSVTLEPMSPADRRIVHTTLTDFPGVATESSGVGDNRKVTILPKPNN